jgi:hypothetical protein
MKRDKRWEHFRASVLAERGRVCEISGATTQLGLHHCFPLKMARLLGRPDIELERRNVLVVSNGPVDYHKHLAHLAYFASWNPGLLGIAGFPDLRECRRMAAMRPPFWTTQEWVGIVANRPKTWATMSAGDKDELRAMIDRIFPMKGD